MSAIRGSSGAVKFRAKQAFLLIGLVSLALFNAGCAGLVSATKSAPENNGDTTAPTVTITAPTAGKTESGSVTVSATATDSVGVTSVQFQLDGANVGSALTAAPYNYVWDTTKSTNGAHVLKATAKDTDGNVGTSSAVSVTVQNSTDTTPPTVSITSPATGATETGTITISANASDNVAVASVQFRVDGTNVGTADTSAPYSFALNTATLSNGSHSLTAVAKDTAGNATTSAAVAITVNNATDTTPPTVSITSPANGATVSGTITISANASDNVAVASVQFRVDGTNVGTADTSAPYSFALNTTTLSKGSHSLTAVAKDAAGNTATSAAVAITVNNVTDTTPPTVSITSPANGATVSGTITISANASDNVGVASVQFRVDGTNVGTADTSAPYSFALNTGTLSNGSHSLTAVAKDAAGNSTTSAAVSVTVNNATDKTPPTVSVTSPTNGATVGGTITVTASASDNVGVASVQFLLDGALLGSKVTTSPYSVQWATSQSSSGSHTLAAQAWDAAGNTATSINVTVTVAQNNPPPPPPPVGDQITISEETGSAQANRPVSVARPFAQGEIANFAQASINGTAALTQCDVKNRWPDGSLKFAIVSFIVPSIPANGSVVVSFSNQTTGNNSGPLTQAAMLDAAYNFDGQIKLAGAASHNISARAMLSAATSCTSPTTDPDGTIGTNLCTYWLQGPIVTAVILEDRAGRSFDVNVDGSTGNPLHPRFEAWFYPSTNQVQLGYTLEDIWASATSSSSARDQVLSSVALTGGNTNPVTEFSNGAFTMITRSMIHKTYCINGTNAGAPYDCLGSSLHIDHSWPYLASTRAFPHWDTTLTVLPSAIAGEYSSLFGNTAALALQGCPTTNCVGGGPGVGNYPTAFDATGASPFHGIVPTWDTFYLMTQCDAGNSTSSKCGGGSPGDMRAVMLTNADLAGRVPYWFREADTNAGHGQTFDNSGIPGNVQTLGRVVSINARWQISLEDVTASVNQCNTNYPADYINYGGSGQDMGGFDTDTSHWPNIAYSSYLTTGQYHYYEAQLMQAANALANSPGTRACTQPTATATLRMANLGYWYLGDERGTNWTKRENLYGAFVAVDGSPERAYFLDKLNANLAIEEALHGVPNDIGSAYAAAYTFGQTSRCNSVGGACPNTLASPLGVWNSYSNAYTQDGQPPAGNTFYPSGGSNPVPGNSDANFQAAFSAVVVGMAYDMGFTSSALPQFTTKRYIHLTQDPTANIYTLSNYVFPTTDANNNWFTNWASQSAYWASTPTHWPGIGGGTCQGGDEPYDLEGLAAFSYGYAFSDAGFSAASGWNAMRSQLQPCWADTSAGYGFPFDPKWDITPRASTGGGSTSPTVTVTAPTSQETVSGMVTMAASASSSTGIASVQFNLDGAKFGSAITSSPYSSSMSTMSVANGQHVLTATATDTSNNQATSAPVPIVVNNTTDTTAPSVPTGLSAAAVSSSLINLSWTASTDNVGVTGYDIFRNGTQVGTSAGTNYQDTGLTALTTYSYTVAAFDAASNVSSPSASASATTLASSGGGIPTSLGWYEVPNSALTRFCPPNNFGGYGYNYPGACQNVVNAWSGAVADTKRNRLVLWGGGHVDYEGNEVYAFDMNSLQMERLNNPSPPNTTSACVETLSDGNPNSRHTYTNLVYMANVDKMFSHGGSLNDCGNFSSATWVLDMPTLKWQNMNPTGGAPEGINVADYDPGSQLVYLDDSAEFYSYNYQTNAYKVLNNNTPTSYLMSGVIDPKRELFFMVGGVGNAGGGLKAISIAAGSNYAMQDWTSAVSATCGGLTGANYPGLTYDPVQDRIVGWPNFGNTVYLFDPDTKSCTTQTIANGPENSSQSGSANSSNGTFGRLRYFPAFGVFTLVNDGEINVHTLRMTPAN